MTPFDRIASIAELRFAFAKVLANGGGAGGDGENLDIFARQSDLRIARLSRELLEGLYHPGPLRHVSMPKAHGGTRFLSIPTITDRVAQGAAATVLSSILEPHFETSSFAYRPGRSVKQAVERVSMLRRQGYGFVVDGDIRSFFDEVPHGPLIAKLGRLVHDNRLIGLIGLWLESFSSSGRGLAQGSPVSPVLSNLYLDALDESFGEGAVRIVRFADDFVLLAKTALGADRALARATKLLAEEGLAINPEKTRIVPLDTAFSFLGHLFVRSMAIEQAPPEPGEMRLAAANIATPTPPSALSVVVRPPAPEPAAKASIVVPAPRLPPTDEDLVADLAGDRDGEDFAAGLAPLYVLQAGRRLGAEREAFVVSENGGRLLAVPARLVGRIDIGPEVEVDDIALRLAGARGVPVAFLDGLGQPQAVLAPPVGEDGALHLAQARVTLDGERALACGRAIVSARLANARALLKRLNRRRKKEAVEATCEHLLRSHKRAGVAPDMAAARGLEGEGARLYWRALGQCLEHGATLETRRGTEAANPVKAVLDFTASLLTRDMRAAILRAGLHPGFGTLHATNDRHDACVYDLMEAFRAPLAEGLTIYLFNNRIVPAVGHAVNDRGLRLTSEAARAVVRGFETWMARPIRNPRTGRTTTWRGMLLLEARAFAAAARAGETFRPYRMDF